MKIGIIQHNPLVGDFSGNYEKILQQYRQLIDQGVDFVLSPEMALWGYPALDAVWQESYLNLAEFMGTKIGQRILVISP